ncbi:MAG: DUF4350 domain-containing protein [Anaerosomatales bacterium]|nr:DUF4350 domain-containing protein [Anaerosomatales bacterium]MDT8434602.1 DUF4350 domain-containing protein [Anaerosomatales bacterium]
MRTIVHTLTRLTIAAALAATALPAAAGCARQEQSGPASTPEQGLPPLGTIVFDMAHGEVFGAQDTTPLGQSGAVGLMRDAGYEVVINQDEITVDDLEGASGLVLAGPMVPLRDAEYEVVTRFIEAGGTVLLTIHVPFPVLKVPAHWGLPVGTEIMMSRSPAGNPAEPSVFVADSITESPITEGVSQVLIVSGWPVAAASSDGKIIVSTREDTWLAAAGDQAPEPPADVAYGSLGLVGVTQLGQGRIVVCGDDAIFANLALGEADNTRLLRNIIDLMSIATEV